MVAKYIICLIQPSIVEEPAEVTVSITAADSRRHNIQVYITKSFMIYTLCYRNFLLH